MQPESALPTSIRARVHDSAIDRVSRFFNATLDDIFVELLQNARRASATEIRVSTSLLSEGRWTVTVADDGAGIADPAILLSFAESAWSTQTASLEDPAGIGFYSLARHGCAVASRPLRETPAWTARICPDAFLGKADALVRPDDSAPSPHGTAISFVTDRNPDCVESTLAAAARHYPLPVRFNGRQLHFQYFLEHAVHTQAWAGLTFGVYRNPYRGYDDPDVNFHGRTFEADLPSVECITGGVWSVRADIRACPEFELVLPARKEPVVNDFLQRMREEALLAIYRAIAAHETAPRLSYGHHKRAVGRRHPDPAAAAGARALAPARRRHRPLARTAGMGCASPQRPGDDRRARDPSRPGDVARGREGRGLATAVRPRLPARGLSLVRRPAAGHRLLDRRHPRRAHAYHHRAQGGPRRPRPRSRPPLRREPFKFDARPDAIAIRLHIAESAGRTRYLQIPADVVFMNDEDCYVDDIDPLVTAASDIDADELAALIHRAFFTPSDDADADSHETQKNRFDEEAMRIALTLLASEDEGLKHVIAQAVWREVLWLMPRDRKVDIAIADGKVMVSLGPAPQAAEASA